MAFDLEEQEKIAELKAWWAKFGGTLTMGVLIAALGFAGYNGWQWYVRNQAAEAASVYEALEAAVSAKDAAKMKEATSVLLDKYSATAYAQMAALTAAKGNLDAGDSKTAKAQLQWTVEHAKDDEFKLIARLRLAGLLLDEAQADEALKQLDGTIPADFQAAFADRRGDVYVAQKKMAEARREYESALTLLKADNHAYANVVQVKLDGLSSEFATSAPLVLAEPEKK